MAKMPKVNVQNAAQNARGVAEKIAKSRVGEFAKRRPIVSAAIGMGALGGMASGRRRSGLDKSTRRPTGMYGY